MVVVHTETVSMKTVTELPGSATPEMVGLASPLVLLAAGAVITGADGA